MKILFLITKGEIGGAQKSVLLLAEKFKQDGFDVSIGLGGGSYLIGEADKLGIPIFLFEKLKRTNNPFTNLTFAFELRSFLKKNKFSFLSFNSSNALFGVLGLIGLKDKPKAIFTVHGWGFLSPGYKKNVVLKFIFLLSMKALFIFLDSIIFISEFDKKFAKKFGLDKKGIVIYNGINETEFLSKEDAIKKLGLNLAALPPSVVIGAIGRLEYAKNNEMLIDAFNNLSEDVKDSVVCVIVGDGPEERNLKSQISNLKINDKVFLLGDITDASKYMKAFDIFIIPSRYEGVPYVLLEAMSAGLPIISSNVGGIHEALGSAGILINNSSELTKKLEELIKNESLRNELSEKAQIRSKKFSFDKTYKETKDLIIKVSLE